MGISSPLQSRFISTSSTLLSHTPYTPRSVKHTCVLPLLKSSLANTNVRELGEALVKAGVSSANFSTPLESTVAAIAALQDKGLQPSVAGNALSKIVGILATPEGKGLKKLDDLGLGISQFFTELENGDKAFKGFPAMLDALEAANATNTDFNVLFGREFASAALALRGEQEKLLASEKACLLYTSPSPRD